ncbi:hypothetical protein NW755_014828, partial [Fusarium falciforme]
LLYNINGMLFNGPAPGLDLINPIPTVQLRRPIPYYHGGLSQHLPAEPVLEHDRKRCSQQYYRAAVPIRAARGTPSRPACSDDLNRIQSTPMAVARVTKSSMSATNGTTTMLVPVSRITAGSMNNMLFPAPHPFSRY